jgi:hypothetical protein
MEEVIRLHNPRGIARKSGTDDHGNQWIEFETDHFAGEEPGTCSICEETIESGWLCLDGGDEVCDRHAQMEPWSDEGVAGRPEPFRCMACGLVGCKEHGAH